MGVWALSAHHPQQDIVGHEKLELSDPWPSSNKVVLTLRRIARQCDVTPFSLADWIRAASAFAIRRGVSMSWPCFGKNFASPGVASASIRVSAAPHILVQVRNCYEGKDMF